MDSLPLTSSDTFIAVMRSRREQRGLSQDELAQQLGLNSYTIKSWESGDKRPRLPSAIRWAQRLGLKFEIRLADVAAE